MLHLYEACVGGAMRSRKLEKVRWREMHIEVQGHRKPPLCYVRRKDGMEDGMEGRRKVRKVGTQEGTDACVAPG